MSAAADEQDVMSNKNDSELRAVCKHDPTPESHGSVLDDENLMTTKPQTNSRRRDVFSFYNSLKSQETN